MYNNGMMESIEMRFPQQKDKIIKFHLKISIRNLTSSSLKFTGFEIENGIDGREERKAPMGLRGPWSCSTLELIISVS